MIDSNLQEKYNSTVYVLSEEDTKIEKVKKDKRVKNKGFFLNVLINLFIFGFAIWIGGSIIRSSIIYDIYEPFSDFIPKKEYSDTIKIHNIYLYNNTSIYTNVAYFVSLVSGILLLFFNIKFLKQKGWLFISLILLIFATPIEIYNIYSDYMLYYVLRWDGGEITFFDGNLQKYAIERFTNLFQRTLGVISFMSAITILVLSVWKPLDKSNNEQL